MASATLAGSFGSGGGGVRDVFTLQNLKFQRADLVNDVHMDHKSCLSMPKENLNSIYLKTSPLTFLISTVHVTPKTGELRE